MRNKLNGKDGMKKDEEHTASLNAVCKSVRNVYIALLVLALVLVLSESEWD